MLFYMYLVVQMQLQFQIKTRTRAAVEITSIGPRLHIKKCNLLPLNDHLWKHCDKRRKCCCPVFSPFPTLIFLLKTNLIFEYNLVCRLEMLSNWIRLKFCRLVWSWPTCSPFGGVIFINRLTHCFLENITQSRWFIRQLCEMEMPFLIKV